MSNANEGRVLYGLHPVREALKAGRVQSLFLVDGQGNMPAIKEIVELARRAQIKPNYGPSEALDELVAGALHQGAVALSGEYPYAQLDEILALAKKQGVPPLLL